MSLAGGGNVIPLSIRGETIAFNRDPLPGVIIFSLHIVVVSFDFRLTVGIGSDIAQNRRDDASAPPRQKD